MDESKDRIGKSAGDSYDVVAPVATPALKVPTEGGERVGRAATTEAVVCPKCGHKMKSLGKKGTCTECGAVIDPKKAFHDELVYTDAAWVAELGKGAFLMLVGLAAAFVLFVVPLFFDLPRMPLWVIIVLGGAPVWVEWVGVRRLTMPEPSPLVAEFKWGWRYLFRVGTTAVAVLDSLMRLGLLVRLPPRGMEFFFLTLSLAVWVRALFRGFYMESLARRIPDDGLARWTMTVTWGLVVTMPVPLALMCIAASPTPAEVSIQASLVLGSAVPGILFLIFSGWGLWLTARYAMDLRASAAEAGERGSVKN